MRALADRSLALSMRCYRGLLRAYPQAFLAEFEDLLCQAFGDLAHRAVRTNGIRGLFALWIRSIPDIMNSAVREHFRSALDWSFRLRWIFACSIAIPTPFMLVFLVMFIPSKIRLLLNPPFDFATFGFLLSASLHGLTSGYLQSRTIGWKRPRRVLWVFATIVGMATAMGLMLEFYPLRALIGRAGAQILCVSALGTFQSLTLARKNVRAVAWIPATAIGWAAAWRIRDAMPLVHLPIRVLGADTVLVILFGGLLAGIAYGALTVLPLEWILQPRESEEVSSESLSDRERVPRSGG
jgi:hypothetical protein